MSTGNGTHEKRPDADPLDELSVDPDHVEQDLVPAQRTVVIHQGQAWPTGVFCRNCHGRWPCRLYRWGHLVLWLAGWREADIVRLVRQAERGGVPYFVSPIRHCKICCMRWVCREVRWASWWLGRSGNGRRDLAELP